MSNDHILKEHYLKSDKIMLVINIALVVYGFTLAPWHNTWAEALIVGIVTVASLLGIYYLVKGTLISRLAMATSFMVMTALHIHQSHGMIEMHFGVFLLLGVLLYYRDWLPIVLAASITAVHHFVFYYYQSQGFSVWVVQDLSNGWWVMFLHAGYVIVQTGLFVWLSMGLRRDAVQSKEMMTLIDNIISRDCIDLTLRSSGATSLLKRFDGFIEEVAMLAQEVRTSAGQLNNNGETLAGLTEEMKNGAEIQQQETNMIATAVEQIARAIGEVSCNAEEAAISASKVDDSASDATVVSGDIRGAIEGLADQVGQAAEQIKGLHDKSKNIGSVLDVIRGIAEQTNLLALNAAIEAARAGDQGRGFAVVADEVRTLAKRTQQSTEEIDHMIEGLQKSSESAVVRIEDSLSHVDACVDNTKGSLELMKKVSLSIGEINEMNAVISTSSGEQAGVIDDISEKLASISASGRKTADDSVKAADSGSALLQMSANLNDLTRRFKVG